MLNLLSASILALAPWNPTLPVHPGTPVARVQWRIDRAHSEMSFRIRHLMTVVTGTFHDWEGTIWADGPDWAGSSVAVQVRTSSIDTRNDRRDSHLRSADFFECDRFPLMTFRSSGVVVDSGRVTLSGDLTLHGITHPVVLTGRFLGLTPGRDGEERADFQAETRINRLDYGLTWNRVAEAGGLLLGDVVDIAVRIEAVRESEE